MEIHIDQISVIDDLNQYSDIFDCIFNCCYTIEKNDVLARCLICNSNTKSAIVKRFSEIGNPNEDNSKIFGVINYIIDESLEYNKIILIGYCDSLVEYHSKNNA